MKNGKKIEEKKESLNPKLSEKRAELLKRLRKVLTEIIVSS